MMRSSFTQAIAAIALFAITAMSVAVADPPPPPPLAVWSAIKDTVDLELTCAGKVRRDIMPAGTMVKYYSTGACRLTGTVRTPSGTVAIPGRDFNLSAARGTSTHVELDGRGKFIFA